MPSLRRLAALLAPLAAVAHAAMDPGDGFNLVLFDVNASSPNAPVCLDGTPAGYYFRPGVGAQGSSTYIIELEGGGWCISEADCLQRSTTDLGSSKSWPASGSPTMDGGSHGLFSNNCADNLYFCNASMAHINYADGASFGERVRVGWRG
jgi:hypothetical protein